MIIIMKNITYK